MDISFGGAYSAPDILVGSWRGPWPEGLTTRNRDVDPIENEMPSDEIISMISLPSIQTNRTNSSAALSNSLLLGDSDSTDLTWLSKGILFFIFKRSVSEIRDWIEGRDVHRLQKSDLRDGV